VGGPRGRPFVSRRHSSWSSTAAAAAASCGSAVPKHTHSARPTDLIYWQ